MTDLDETTWAERAIAWKDEAPAIEGPLETVVNAISRLPALAWMSFSITLPDRADPPFLFDGALTRKLVAILRAMPRG